MGKKGPICYHNNNDISAKMAIKYNILTDTPTICQERPDISVQQYFPINIAHV
jgi:hypothetical protein